MISVLLAGVVYWILGALWYSQLMFGKNWMKLADVKEEKHSPMAFILGIIFSILTAHVLAYVIKMLGITSLIPTLKVSFLMWFGFIATTGMNPVLYEKKSFKLYIINSGYALVGFFAMATIIHFFK